MEKSKDGSQQAVGHTSSSCFTTAEVNLGKFTKQFRLLAMAQNLSTTSSSLLRTFLTSHRQWSIIIHPAVTQSHSVIVLVQNGLKIEKPIISAFPRNPVISGISRMSSTELSHGEIFHQDPDILVIGPFDNPNIASSISVTAAKSFVDLYNATGKVTCVLEEDFAFIRWRKLVYDASFNSLCAITSIDTLKLQLTEFPVEELLRPAMKEIMAIAKAAKWLCPIIRMKLHLVPT